MVQKNSKHENSPWYIETQVTPYNNNFVNITH